MDITIQQAQQISAQAEQERKQEQKEFQETLKEAREDFNAILENPEDLTYDNVEKMMLSHGLEMDFIFDLI